MRTPDRFDEVLARLDGLEDGLARLEGVVEIIARKTGLPAWSEETESFEDWLGRIEEEARP